MTKQVRVENADMSSFGVTVEIWDKSSDGVSPDTLVETLKLSHPTAMIDKYITSTRYFVVKETVELVNS